MRITTKLLLRYLPIDDNIRQKVLANMDSYSPDQKYELEKTLWTMFDELLETNYNYELKQALMEVKGEVKNLSSDFNAKIEEQVYQRMMRDLQDEQEAETIEELRNDIKKMMTDRLRNRLPQNQDSNKA